MKDVAVKRILTLFSFPGLIWAYVQYPEVNQYDWKWLVVAFLIYGIFLLRFLGEAVESPRQYGFNKNSSVGGRDSGGSFLDVGDAGGGDCGGGGGD
jgi:uncharacterized membrane protein YgcG